MERIDDKPHIWLDMDPGIDDAWAIAAAHATCVVRGVSAVAGNVPLPNTFGNAQRIMDVVGSRASLWPGADKPLLSPLITAEEFHGKGGVGTWEGREVPVDADAERVWTHWASVGESLRTVHLIATGPLTNVAIGVLAHPALGAAFASMTAMCGAMPGAQLDKAQEFNVYVDPHAADVVFHWAQRVHLVGINVAHKALIPIRDLERLGRFGAVGRMLKEMLSFYSNRARGEGGDPGAFPIDDVVAVAAVAAPNLFRWREMPLAVVREGPLRGTVVISPVDIKRPNVKVAVDVDADGFRDWVWHSMEAYRDSP